MARTTKREINGEEEHDPGLAKGKQSREDEPGVYDGDGTNPGGKSGIKSGGASEMESDGKSRTHSGGKSGMRSDGKGGTNSDGKSGTNSDGKGGANSGGKSGTNSGKGSSAGSGAAGAQSAGGTNQARSGADDSAPGSGSYENGDVSGDDDSYGDAASETQEGDAGPAVAIQDELAAERDKYLRLAAEYDNYRKRSVKERETIYNDARADAISKMLPVYDNIDRALKMECADEAFYKGVEMIMTQMTDILDALGVEPIPAVGEPFDPNRHNAVQAIEDPALGEKIVAEEYQKGFMIGDRVIRFSTVVVAN